MKYAGPCTTAHSERPPPHTLRHTRHCVDFWVMCRVPLNVLPHRLITGVFCYFTWPLNGSTRRLSAAAGKARLAARNADDRRRTFGTQHRSEMTRWSFQFIPGMRHFGSWWTGRIKCGWWLDRRNTINRWRN